MPKNFVLNKNTEPGKCDARRCDEAYEVLFNNGAKLCSRHASMLVPEDCMEPIDGSQPPAGEKPKEESIQQYIDPVIAEAKEQAEKFEALEVADQEDAELVGALLVELKNREDEVEAKRTEITQPINKSLRAINALFKPAKDAIGEAQKILKGKLTAWSEEQERARRTAMASGNFREAMAIVPATVPETMTEKKIWTYEVQDIHVVPRDLLELNHEAVKELMRASDPETLEIPGLRFFQKSQMVMKARR